MTPQERLIIALDDSDASRLLNLAQVLSSQVKTFKIGLTAYDKNGPNLVNALRKLDREVFLDLKLFDIPAQVGGAVRVLTDLDIRMLTVHALGGVEMMKAAKEASVETAARLGRTAPLVLAVTIPTSLDKRWLTSVGFGDLEASVRALADAAREAGMDGVVASAGEAGALRQDQGDDFVIVVPGIRLPAADAQDQKRIATPEEALEAGADYLVIGRPITAAADPAVAAAEVLRRLS